MGGLWKTLVLIAREEALATGFRVSQALRSPYYLSFTFRISLGAKKMLSSMEWV